MTRPAIGLAIVVLLFPCLGAAQDNPTRIAKTIRGTPIITLLRPDDTFVEVQRGDVISLFVDDRLLSLSQDLDERAQLSDTIAVVEPRDFSSFLVENGWWARSKLNLHVVRVLKDRRPTILDSNGDVTVEHDGGELSLNGVRVRVGEYLLFKSGERYLVSLKVLSNGKIAFIGMQFKVSSDDRIAPIYRPNGEEVTAPSELYGRPLNQIAEEITRRVQRNQ